MLVFPLPAVVAMPAPGLPRPGHEPGAGEPIDPRSR